MSSIIYVDEKLALLITVFVLGLVFGSWYLLTGDLLAYLLVTIVASIAVIPHELAHRWSARKMGCYSRYVLSPFGLLLTLITAIPFIPFKIIMPGFTLVTPRIYDPYYLKRVMGITSYMGPLTNILFSVFSLATLILLSKLGYIHGVLYLFLILNTRLNAWVAFFNLLPVPPLDGSKIIVWNTMLWIATFILSIALYIVSTFIL